MIGVTPFISMFKPAKDWNKIAKKKAKDSGVSEEDIKKEWEDKKETGTRIHSQIQSELEVLDNVLSFHRDFTEEGSREAVIASLPEKDEKLENGKIYLERPVFTHKQGLWGFPDKIEVKKNTIHVEDIKTWKSIYRQGTLMKTANGWERESFSEPINHIQSCNYYDAVLQLSMYMHIIWENNKHLKVGNLSIRHIRTNSKDMIIGDDIIYVPYLREEINNLLKFKKINQI